MKNIIVTGASSGIGFQLAIQLFTNYKSNVIVIARSKSKLLELKEYCLKLESKYQSTITIIVEDIKNTESIINKLKSDFNKIDILINNAGTLINKSFLEINEDEIKNQFETNFFAPARLIKATVPLLQKSTIAHIVNIGSMGGYQGSYKFQGLSYYSASKAALANLTESLAVELSRFNIKVNCLALGAINTSMLKKAFPKANSSISPKEIAEIIVNFSLLYPNVMNGAVIPFTSFV